MSEETLKHGPTIVGPHIVSRDERPKVSQIDMLNAITAVACKYLLWERETETTVRAALAALAQERHNEYHTKGGHKDGDGTSFQDCNNEKCRDIVEILTNYREPSVEFNQITAEMMESKFHLHILKGTNTVVVSLKDKSKIDAPPPIPTVQQEGTIIKV